MRRKALEERITAIFGARGEVLELLARSGWLVTRRREIPAIIDLQMGR